MSLTLSKADRTDAGAATRFQVVRGTSHAHDGYQPFNEQAILDLNAGRRSAVLIEVDGGVVGAAILGGGELDLVIEPRSRRQGYAGEALVGLLAAEHTGHSELTAWSHGDHPGARALASRFGFEAVRTLLQLRLGPIPPVGDIAARPGAGADSFSISTFRPGADDAEWVALNALVFAHHPEQGSITAGDLGDRQAEPWFDAGDFLLARDASGRLVGYNWLKIEPGAPGIPDATIAGEIYVIGIHPDAAGRGLGRVLMNAGLARLRDRGVTTATLYVEADNASAVHLYRSLGFTDHTVDVQYRRPPH
ncbi:mycothiol synthase [Glaciibacter superstes]|uniref:mycothiol synthase n=1 Tax=Glaciibacter superstes TaxID=501023 RepID=UPI0004196505|nr:mycothiol synthase [Glaciibacter superstes]